MPPVDPAPAALAACFITSAGVIVCELSGPLALAYLVVVGLFALALLVVAGLLRRRP
jgi:hypothetical protein